MWVCSVESHLVHPCVNHFVNPFENPFVNPFVSPLRILCGPFPSLPPPQPPYHPQHKGPGQGALQAVRGVQLLRWVGLFGDG